MATILYVFTMDDAQYVAGRELTEAEGNKLREVMNRELTQAAVNLVHDVTVYEAPDEPEGPICPRCGHFIPRDSMPGAYPGALSRVADVYICSVCGLDEAVGLGPVPHDQWPIKDWAPRTKAIDEATYMSVRVEREGDAT